MNKSKLEHSLAELKNLTGITLEAKANTPEELEHTHKQLQSLILAYKEKHNQVDFLLSLLKSDSSISNIPEFAKRLHIDPYLTRIMLLVDFKTPVTESTIEVLANLIDSTPKAIIVPVNKHQLVLLKPVQPSETKEDYFNICHMIIDTLSMEALVSAHISFSDSFNDLSIIGTLYKESTLALKVGKLFHSEKQVYPNNKLGLGRLIDDIPVATCNKFITEVFGRDSSKLLDEETSNIVNIFIKNNLNIAETARQLHMHRNTLIFRLEKLEAATGLDLRNVEDTLTFRIATMIVSYNKFSIE
jgi:carbohydrate diacid regulator